MSIATRSARLPVIAGLSLALLLSGCGSQESEPEAESTAEPPALSEALAELYVPAQDSPDEQTDAGQCLTEAIEGTELSEQGRDQLREGADQDEDLGSVIAAMSEEDREIMLSNDLRGRTDDCLLEITDTSAPAPKASSSEGVDEQPQDDAEKKKPNTKPAFDVDEDKEIQDSGALRRGAVSMFSSFAADEQQKKVYEKSGDCFAQTIFGSGLSQEGMRFIAGGAPLGTGSVAEHLNEEDRAVWESPAFTDLMLRCTQEAQQDLDDEEATADPSSRS